MRLFFAPVLALLLLPAFYAGRAQAAPVLFADFVWGTPKSELEKITGAAPGQDAFAGDLFLPGTRDFAGESWNVRLVFAKERLVQVGLMAHYSRERMDKVSRQLRADKFEMLSVLIDSSSLDLVKVLKSGGPDSVKEEWARFARDKKPERMTYAWFDTSGMSETMKMTAGSLPQLLMMSPPETREVEVTLLRDPAAAAPGMLFVDFSFPVLR